MRQTDLLKGWERYTLIVTPSSRDERLGIFVSGSTGTYEVDRIFEPVWKSCTNGLIYLQNETLWELMDKGELRRDRPLTVVFEPTRR